MRFGAGKITACLGSTGLSLLTTASVFAASPTLTDGEPPAAPAPAPIVASALPAPVHLWSAQAINDLQSEAMAAEQEGLDPAAYDIATLLSTYAARGESEDTDRVASAIALGVARDYASGRIIDKSRFDWHIDANADDLNRLSAELQSALRGHRLRPWLRSLLPADPRYAALRTAYATTPTTDSTMRDRLRANLERWRWMPRTLGKDHIYVNVPSYSLAVVEDGRPVSTYTVVVGKPSTPTPQISVAAQSIVVNPWWNLPTSISAKMRSGAKGFVSAPGGGLRQPPGPRNALGRVKIDMPNAHSIYLHDTPSKALFAQQSRAFSHGCIRVKDIDRLAVELASLDQGTDKPVRQALAGTKTRTVALEHSRPVYLVYFTADVGKDGSIVRYDDPYGRDARLVQALDGTTRIASAKGRTGLTRYAGR